MKICRRSFTSWPRSLKKVAAFDFISVLLYDPADQVMRLHILQSDRPLNTGIGPDHPPPDSPGGWVWQSQEPMVISDYGQETRFPRITPVSRAYGMQSGCYLPLTTLQRRLGAINFASARRAPMTPGTCACSPRSRAWWPWRSRTS